MVADKDIIDPPYYQLTSIQPRDVVWSWCGWHGALAHILSYLQRAGHKPNNDVLNDLRKARTWLDFAITKIEEERHCDDA